jgi:cell shape-determining protein MreC
MPPVTARIIAVSPEQGFDQTVTIGAGTKQKISEGMLFYYSSKGQQYSVRITQVSAGSSKGDVWSRATTGDAVVEDAPIKIGQKLSSRMPKDFVQPG